MGEPITGQRATMTQRRCIVWGLTRKQLAGAVRPFMPEAERPTCIGWTWDEAVYFCYGANTWGRDNGQTS